MGVGNCYFFFEPSHTLVRSKQDFFLKVSVQKKVGKKSKRKRRRKGGGGKKCKKRKKRISYPRKQIYEEKKSLPPP